MSPHHLICAQRAYASGFAATARAMAEFSLSGGSPFGAAPAKAPTTATVLRSGESLSAAECSKAKVAITGQGTCPPSEQFSSLTLIGT